MALSLLYIRHAKRTASPALDLSLLSVPSFRISMVVGSLIRLLGGATGFLLPLWLQLAIGMSPAKAGGLMVMSSIGVIASRFAGLGLIRLVHPRQLAVVGMGISALTIVAMASLSPSVPLILFYVVLGCQGLVMAIPMTVIGAVAYVDIGPEKTSAATGFYSTVQQLTLSLGVTVAVWTIAAMRWLTGDTPYDNGTYRGSLLVFALFAVAAAFCARRLDVASTGTLRARKA
jgi:MFS family permease